MPALRVAFVVGSATGGTAGHVGTLAVGCRDAGLAVTVFGPERAADSLGSAHISVTPVRIGDRPRPASDAVAVARLRAGLRFWRPDVVHAHGVRAGAFAALALSGTSRMGRPALAVTLHNAPPADWLARRIYGLLELTCARRADIVLCASADLAARMGSRGAAAVEQFDVPAAAAQPPTVAEVAKARTDIGAGRPVVLAVARLAPQKGLDVLIEAAARWRGRDPEPVTVIAGAGRLMGQLVAQADQVGADVQFLGARHDVPALLAMADVVVVPSRWEARALILQEAMRAGRPVIATRVGGTADLTGEDAAVLIPPDDPGALAAAVSALLDDPQRAARLGLAASARSATFPSQQDAVRAVVAIYARLVSGDDHSTSKQIGKLG
jgi:glycosyltransferase involved in cell wall biosynthesis